MKVLDDSDRASLEGVANILDRLRLEAVHPRATTTGG